MGNPLLFGETDFTVGFADPMFPIRCATVVELRLQQIGDFYEKPHFTMENFKFRGVQSGVWKCLHQTTKRHTLTSNLVWMDKTDFQGTGTQRTPDIMCHGTPNAICSGNRLNGGLGDPTCNTNFCLFYTSSMTKSKRLQQKLLNRCWRVMAKTTCLRNH